MYCLIEQDEKDALQDQVNEWKEVIDEYNREKESDAQLIKDKNGMLSNKL